MEKRKHKGLFLLVALVLIGAAIVQVFLLFGNSTFVQGEDVQHETTSSVRSSLLKPDGLYVTLGGTTGSPGFSNIEEVDESYETLLEETIALMGRVLQGNEWTVGRSKDLPTQQISCALSYEAWIDQSSLEIELDLAEGHLPEMTFREIWIAPALKTGDEITVCLYDPKTETVYTWKGGERALEENLALHESLEDIVPEARKTLENRYYELNLAFPGTFNSVTFGQDTQVREKYLTADVTEIFRTDEGVNQEVMDRYAMTFFAYPDTVSRTESGDSYFYTNEKISLKLNQDGHMLYVETLTEPEKQPVTLSEAYAQALAFLKKDLAATPSSEIGVIYAGYEIVGEDYVFYFDYILDGLKVSISDYVMSHWGMEHPVVINVRGSKVHRCERYIIAARCNQEKPFTMQTGWLAMANAFAEEGHVLMKQPELVYYYSGNRIKLSWEAAAEDGTSRRVLE